MGGKGVGGDEGGEKVARLEVVTRGESWVFSPLTVCRTALKANPERLFVIYEDEDGELQIGGTHGLGDSALLLLRAQAKMAKLANQCVR